jgi:hypothetical protein
MQRKLNVPGVNKMSEIKTVPYQGQVYQINKYYLFSDDGINLVLGRLMHINRASEHPFNTCQSDLFRYAKEVSCLKSVGTITPAPIELINGAAYMFDAKFIRNAVGIYHKSSHKMYFTEGMCAEAEWLKNVRLMTVESK